jgi:hypothetical protein
VSSGAIDTRIAPPRINTRPEVIMFVRSAPIAALTLALAISPLTAQQAVQIPAKDNALTDRPATVFTVGAEEGESWEMFSGIRALVFDRTDNLYVLDGQNFRVLVFDARGRFVREFGKKGGGPGELQAPLGLAITSDGNIAVSDLANRGYVIYTPAGEYVRNVTFPESLGMPFGRIEGHPRGGIVVRSDPRISPESAADGSGPSFAAFVHQPFGQPKAATPAAREMFRFGVEPPKVMEPGAGRRVVMRMDPAFAARPSFGVLPDGGIAVHHESEYNVKVLDANGRHLRTITRPFKPKKVTKKDQEQELERRKEARASGSGQSVTMTMSGGGGGGGNVSVGTPGRPGGGAAQTFQMNLDDIPFAEFMSVVTNVRTDPLGRVWVQRRNADNSNQGPIDLVTAAGKYIGTLAPQPLPDALSASNLAAYIVRDDMGVERVSVRRLPQAWR